MSETVQTQPAASTKYPADVQDQITKAQSAVVKMTHAERITKAQEMGMNFDPETTNEGWLKRKLGYAVQVAILAQHGLTETPTVKKNREKLESSDPTAAPAIGRKRMATTGSYTLSLGEGGKEGRPNSTKGKVVAAMKAQGVFTYEQFKAAVSEALKWNEETKAFEGDTRFLTLDLATGAWWSELKNKAKIIVEAPTA